MKESHRRATKMTILLIPVGRRRNPRKMAMVQAMSLMIPPANHPLALLPAQTVARMMRMTRKPTKRRVAMGQARGRKEEQLLRGQFVRNASHRNIGR